MERVVYLPVLCLDKELCIFSHFAKGFHSHFEVLLFITDVGLYALLLDELSEDARVS